MTKVKLIATFFLLSITSSLFLSATADEAHSYSRLDPDAWHYADIIFAYENELLIEIDIESFEPDSPVDMTFILTSLRLLGEKDAAEDETGDATVPEDESTEYEDVLEWAFKNGILDEGGSLGYASGETVTREELAVVLRRFFALGGADLSERDNLRRYADTGRISRSALPDIEWTVGVGLMNGTGEHILDPEGIVTMAQFVVVLRRCIEGLKSLPQDIDETEDYVQFSAEEIEEKISGYGTAVTPGMDVSLYYETISAEWQEVIFADDDKPQYLEFGFDKVYSYEEFEQLFFDLAKFENVRLYEIGQTYHERKIYAIEIGRGEKTILLSGGVHACEVGAPYVLYKMLHEKVWSSEYDEQVKAELERIKYAAIVIVNPDGYAYNEVTGSRIDSNNENENGNGVDINRNFPVSSAGFKFDNIGLSGYINNTPDTIYYQGERLGSALETRAVMNFLHKYIVEDKSALTYIDFHQQGRVVFLSPRNSQIDDTAVNREFGGKLVEYLGYDYGPYSIMGDGTGGTTARMAMDFSFGFQMSPYGIMGIPVDGEIIPAVLYKDISGYREYYPNKNPIPAITLELTYVNFNSGLLNNITESGYEYQRYRFNGFLSYLADILA